MGAFISVVSHGHSALIKELSCLSSLVAEFQVVIKSNTPNDDFDFLIQNKNFHWINESHGCGFGVNNNIIFEYCCSVLGMTENDYFIVLNPDVIISAPAIFELVGFMASNKIKVSSINLFKDLQAEVYDNSIRNFPSLIQFVCSFAGFGNTSVIDKNALIHSCKVDWAAGSFLAFEVGHYSRLGGFDERYFMYCEDIDICYRSCLLGERVTYFPNVKALHLAKHENRKLFSIHFYWHIKSVVRFLFTKAGFTAPKSRLI